MNRLITLCFFVLLASCGEDKNEPIVIKEPPIKMEEEKMKVTISDIQSLCDGSDDLVMAIRLEDHHDLGEELIYLENGRLFLYLNGKCEYSILNFVPWQDGGGMRALGPRVGTLSETEGIEFLEGIKWTSWPKIDKTSYTGEYYDRFIIFSKYKNLEFLFSAGTAEDEATLAATQKLRDEGQIRFDIAVGIFSQIKKLWEGADLIQEGDLRIYVQEDQDDGFAWEGLETQPIFMDWPIKDKTVIEISKNQNPTCFGRGYLVSGAEAEAFRKAREEYRAQTPNIKFITSFLGLMDENGKRRRLYIREVLPFENQFGLVDFSGIGDGLKEFCPFD